MRNTVGDRAHEHYKEIDGGDEKKRRPTSLKCQPPYSHPVQPEEGYCPSGSGSRGPAGRALLLVGALVVRTCLRSLRTGLRALRSLLGCALSLVHLLEGLAQCL